MPRYSVTARGLSSVQVEGRNWIVALGLGLGELGREDLERLACEVLPNGTVIARDIASGTGFVVQALDVSEDSPLHPEFDEDVDDADTHNFADHAPMVLGGDDEGTLGTDDLPDASHEDQTYDDEDGAFAQPDDESEELAELPIDAIQQLDKRELLRHRIDEAETVVMACHRTLEGALERVPAESGAVILEENGHMRFAAVTGPHSRKLMGVRLPMGTGVAGFALEKARTIVLTDAHDDPRHCGEVDALTGYVTRAIAVVPIQSGDRLFGVVELMNLHDGTRFTDERVEAIRDMASLLGDRLAEDRQRTGTGADRR